MTQSFKHQCIKLNTHPTEDTVNTPSKKPKTAKQIKDEFARNGMTISEWANQNGYNRNRVYRILNGFDKGLYGEGHEIAVKLGLKLSTNNLST